MGKQFPFRKLHVVPVLVVARIVVVLQIVGAFDIVVVIVLIFVIVRTVVDLHVNLHQIIDLVRFERHSVKKLSVRFVDAHHRLGESEGIFLLYCLLKFRRQITEAGDKAFFRCCRVCHISMFVFNSRFVRQSGFLRSAPFPLVENAEFSLSYPSPAGFRTCRRRSIVWSFIRRFPASGEARKRASPSPRTGNV